MDLHPTPFPGGKVRASNMKVNKKSISESNKEAPFSRQKRVFGTARNQNIPVKPIVEKPYVKPANGVSRQQPKTSRGTTVKSRFTQSQPSSPKLVAKEGSITVDVVSSPAVKSNSDEIEEIADGVVVSSPAVKSQVDETEETEEMNGVVVSNPVETEEITDGVGLPAAVEPILIETNGLTHEVVPSPAVSTKSVEKEELANGVAPSPAVSTKSANGILPSPAVSSTSANGVGSGSRIKAVEKRSSGENKSRSKKSVCFLEPPVGKNGKDEMNTPVVSASTSRIKPPRMSSTPYLSAERCSNCRLHRLESAPYWIAQIKLAESVEKHFVSATFFRLALECNAEPVRSLRIELRSYLARHAELSKDTEWKNISVSYGLLKGENDVSRLNSALDKAAGVCETSTTDDLGQAQQSSKDGNDEKEMDEGVED